MLSFIIAIVLLLLAFAGAVLKKTYSFVPRAELKRQAEAGDPAARVLYRAVAYDASLRALLWLIVGLASAGGFVLLAQVAPAWMGFLLIAIVLWLAFSWLPSTRVTSFSARLALWATPLLVTLLNWLHPVLTWFSGLLQRRYVPAHTGLFERSDLLSLLDQQSQQPDSRLTPEELDLIRHVLHFGDYKVRDSLRPRTLVKSVAAGDTIGPILLDELHASGQTSFPVRASRRSDKIVGALYLNDVGIHSTGKVSDYMNDGVSYVHESDSLADALHAFYQTKRQLFIAVNSFEEYVGVITMEDILHQLVGRPNPDENLGSHEDVVAVANRHPKTPPVTDTLESETTEAEDLTVTFEDDEQTPPEDTLPKTDETVVE